MGWIQKKTDRIKSLGMVPFLMYAAAKFFFGLGLAFLIAGSFPGGGWIFWGMIFVVLAVIFAVPVIKALLRKY